MHKKLALLILTMLLAVALSACNDKEKGSADQKAEDESAQQKGAEEEKGQAEKAQVDKNKTVVTVNDQEIKGSDYNVAYQGLAQRYKQMGQSIGPDQMKQVVIDSLVRQELILQDAEKKGYKASDKKVKEQLTKLKEQYGGEEKFNKLLKQNNLTQSQFKNQISEQLKFNKYMDKELPEIKVTEKEIKDAYEKATANAKGKEVPKLKEVKSTIKTNLKNQKQQKELTKIAEQLKKNSEIEVKI